MKQISEILQKLSLKEKIKITLYILKSLRNSEKSKKYSPIEFSDLEMIFLFHAFYFNVYEAYYNKEVAAEIKKLFDSNSKNLNQISELVEKVGFRRKLSSSFDTPESKEKHIENNSWYNNFPTEKDGEDFYYSYIFQYLQKRIGTRWNNVILAYNLLKIFGISNLEKNTFKEYNVETPDEYKEILKEVIKEFNGFSNPIFLGKKLESNYYRKDSYSYPDSRLLKTLFCNRQNQEIYLGSFTDRFNYSFLEKNIFSTSLIFNKTIALQELRRNSSQVYIDRNNKDISIILQSSLLYLALRYIYEDKISYEKLLEKLNFDNIPLDEYLSSNKKDLIILNDHDLEKLSQIGNRRFYGRMSMRTNVVNGTSLDVKKYLNKGGKLVLLIDPKQWLSENEIFKNCIKNRHVKSIIVNNDLQNNNRLRSYANSDVVIIELTYEKNEEINFINLHGEKSIKKIIQNYNNPKNQQIPSEINNFNSYSQRSIDYNEILTNEDLNPTIQLFDIYNSISLGKILSENKISRRGFAKPDKKSKIIFLKLPTLSDVRNLTLANISFEKNSQVNWFIKDFKELKFDDFDSMIFEKLIPNSLIIMNQFSGSNLRLGYFNPSDTSIDYYFTRERDDRSIQYSIIDENYEPEFILIELSKPYVIAQIKRYSGGTYLRRFSLDLIEKLSITDQGIDEQKNIIDSFYNSINKFLELKIDKELEQESKVAIWDEFHHDINHPLADINSYIRLIKKIDSNNLKESFYKIQEYANFIESDIESIYKQLKSTDELINLTDKKIERIPLIPIIEKLKLHVSKYNNMSKFNSKISMFEKSDLDDMVEAEDDNILKYVTQHTMDGKEIVFNDNLKLYGDSLLFDKLINNILRNTELYAFDKKDNNNKVLISLDHLYELNKNGNSEHFIIIELSNNGKPFKKDYSKESFVRLNKKSVKGTGSGGAYINEIARKFNNPGWEFITFPDKKSNEIAVIYRFKFKLYE